MKPACSSYCNSDTITEVSERGPLASKSGVAQIPSAAGAPQVRWEFLVLRVKEGMPVALGSATVLSHGSHTENLKQEMYKMAAETRSKQVKEAGIRSKARH